MTDAFGPSRLAGAYRSFALSCILQDLYSRYVLFTLPESAMEKRAVIEPGRTPPDDTSAKEASANLESHPTRRLSDGVEDRLAAQVKRDQEAQD